MEQFLFYFVIIINFQPSYCGSIHQETRSEEQKFKVISSPNLQVSIKNISHFPKSIISCHYCIYFYRQSINDNVQIFHRHDVPDFHSNWFDAVSQTFQDWFHKNITFIKPFVIFNSDGNIPSNSIDNSLPLFIYTKNLSKVETSYLTFTPYDVMKFPFEAINEAVQNRRRYFNETIAKIFWRGSAYPSPHSRNFNDLAYYPRFRVCIMSNKEKHWLDACFQSALNMSRSADETICANNTKRSSVQEMTRFRYQLDIGGWSGTTWGALRWKLSSSSVVFLVNSSCIDWWHYLLVPWVHFVPVAFDLHDLRSNFEYMQAHLQFGSEMVKNANALMEKVNSNFFRETVVMSTFVQAGVVSKKSQNIISYN